MSQFDNASIKRISAAVRAVERNIKTLNTNRPNRGSIDEPIIGKLDGSLERGSFASPNTATVSVYKFNSGNTLADTDTNITMYSIGAIPDGTTLVQGTTVYASIRGGRWILDGYDCEAG